MIILSALRAVHTGSSHIGLPGVTVSASFLRHTRYCAGRGSRDFSRESKRPCNTELRSNDDKLNSPQSPIEPASSAAFVTF
jgi:hypothetical protein